MPFVSKPVYRFITIVSATAMSLWLASCSESKVSQCNKLIDVANQAVNEVQTVTKSAGSSSNTSNTPNNIAAMGQIADAADKAKNNMSALQLKDKQLQDFQQRFITMYSDTSKATRSLVDAANAKNAEGAQKAFNSLKEATNRESPLVNEVNTYCKGG